MNILIGVIIVTVIGLIAGVILTAASKLFAVPVDETASKIRDVLPGANCGGCGYSGCDGYAEAVASGKAKPNLCSVGGAEAAAKIGEILGTEVEIAEKRTAVLKCKGTCDATSKKFTYDGIATCAAANMVHGGDASCEFGCLGYGDCTRACEFGAASLENGIAHFDPELCTACGKCAAACPRGLIELRPVSKTHTVSCSSKLNGAKQRKLCTAGCIGCMKCTKVCPSQAITVENNLAKINYELCTNCGACAENCPTKCITL